MFRKILPIVAILFIVALAVSDYFHRQDEESIMIYQEYKNINLS